MSDLVFFSFPTIDLGDVILREINVDKDYEAFFYYMNDPKVKKYIAEDDLPKSLDSAQREIRYWYDLYRYKRSIYWAVANRKDKLIGTCGFNLWNRTHGRGEISYDLDRTYWGKGLATKIVRAVCDYGFGAMKMKRIQATVAIDNIASIKVLEKNYFQQEGILRQYGTLHKEVKDFYMYSLLPQDVQF